MRQHNLKIDWIDFQRAPRCAPDPRWPNGKPVDLRASPRENYCVADLPYPAKGCGMFVIKCERCKMQIGVTTAGRPDDPTRISVPCKAKTKMH